MIDRTQKFIFYKLSLLFLLFIKHNLYEPRNKNHLYIKYNRIDDKEYKVNEENKKSNREHQGGRLWPHFKIFL